MSNDKTSTDIYTLSLHDALPILSAPAGHRLEPVLAQNAPDDGSVGHGAALPGRQTITRWRPGRARSEEHTSELQSHVNLVCRLLFEKNNIKTYINFINIYFVLFT